MFFNNSAFNGLLQLSPANMGIFFQTTRFGVGSNVDAQLLTLLVAQNQPTRATVVVMAPSLPSYSFPSVTGSPNTMFYHPHVHEQHRYTSGHTMGSHGNVHGHN